MRETLKLKQIIKHRDLQVREQLDMNRVEFLTEVFEGWDALLVYRVDGKYYLADGYHRITAAERLGLEVINAEVVEGTFEDALLAGIEANSQHRGLPLTLKERKRAAELLLKTHANWSNRRIAKIAGLSEGQLRNLRSSLENQGIIQPVEKRVGADGKEYPGHIDPVKMTGSEGEEPEPEPEPPPWEGKLLCPADALELLPQEPKQHYDLILTDPPYNITEGEGFPDMESYLKFTSEWLLLALPLLKLSGRLYVCFSYQHLLRGLPVMHEAIRIATELYPFTFGPPIIWHHANTISAAHNQREYKPTYDVILYWYGPDAPPLIADDAYTGDERGAVWNIAVPQSNFTEGKWHKFQKPLELIDRIIKGATRVGDRVLDPFAGSGTTAVACVRSGRDYKIIEKDPKYLSVIEQRLTQAYGKNEGRPNR